LLPTVTDGFDGETRTAVTTGAETVRVVPPLTVPMPAVMVTEP
jgi:hypothetical protein